MYENELSEEFSVLVDATRVAGEYTAVVLHSVIARGPAGEPFELLPFLCEGNHETLQATGTEKLVVGARGTYAETVVELPMEVMVELSGAGGGYDVELLEARLHNAQGEHLIITQLLSDKEHERLVELEVERCEELRLYGDADAEYDRDR